MNQKVKRLCLDQKQDGLSKAGQKSLQNIYFFNLEKKNYDRRIIMKELKNENSEITTNFKDINAKL